MNLPLCLLSQDNVLAAEKPPDAPGQEGPSDVFLKKEDFLFDSFDPWKGPQAEVASENDVFLLDENTGSVAAVAVAAEFPENTLEQEQGGTTAGMYNHISP